MMKCPHCGVRVDPVQGNCPVCRKAFPGMPIDDLAQTLWCPSLAPGQRADQSIRSRPLHQIPPATLHLRMRKVSQTPGRQADSDYELLRVLGQGGMGLVYQARQTAISRSIALKMMRPGSDHQPQQQNLFLAEAMVTGCLDHPNIVPIHDLGQDEQGRLFYAMREVRGHPWSETLHTRSLGDNLDILLRVCDAIAFAHSRGVVHRDLKPQNVMLGEFGEVVVMDWGLAASVQDLSPALRVTEQTAFCGTPAYMAPEMAMGLSDLIGPQSDVYLLGALLFEIIAGKPPHVTDQNDAMDVLTAAALNHLYPTPVRGELYDIALKAMADAPVNRHASVQDFQAAIRAYREHQESERLAASAGERLQEAARSKRYDDYAEAVFGYRQALRIWPENRLAQTGLGQAQIQYATAAMMQNDLDLASSLVEDAPDEETQRLRHLIRSRIHERDRQLARIRFLRRGIAGVSTLLLLLALISTYWINRERIRASRGEAAATQAFNESKRLLSESLEAQAGREIELDHPSEALALLASALRHDPSNRVAAARTIDLLTRKNWVLPVFDIHEPSLSDSDLHPFSPPPPYPSRNLAEEQVDRNTAYLRVMSTDSPPREMGPIIGPFLSPATAPTHGAISADGRFAAYSAGNRLLHVWDRCAQNPAAPPRPLNTYLCTLAFAPHGPMLVTGTRNGRFRFVNFWDHSSLRENFILGQCPSGQFVHNRNYFDLSSRDRQDTRLLDMRPGRPLDLTLNLGHRIHQAQFTPDGQRLVLVTRQGNAWVYCRKTGTVLLGPIDHNGRSVRAFAIAPDGQRCASANVDGEILLWSLEDGAVLARAQRHTGPVNELTFSPDNRRLLTGGEDGFVRLWDAATLAPIGMIPADGPVRSLAFSPHANHVLIGAGDRPCVWDAAHPENPPRFFDSSSWVRAVDIHPNGHLALFANFAYAQLFDLDTGKWLSRVEGHHDSIWQARFNPNGTSFATVSFDGSLRIWDLNGRPLTPFLTIHDGTPGGADTLAFSADGEWVAAGANRGIVRVWDAVKGRELLTPLQVATDRIASIEFSRDKQQLLTASWDGTATILDLVPVKEPIPWLPDLAEAIGGLKRTETGYEIQPWTTRIGLLHALQGASTPSPGEILPLPRAWLQWFLADRGRRPVSPWSNETVPEAVARRLESKSIQDLEAAIDMAPNRARGYVRLAEALCRSEPDRAAYLAATARSLDPAVNLSPELEAWLALAPFNE